MCLFIISLTKTRMVLQLLCLPTTLLVSNKICLFCVTFLPNKLTSTVQEWKLLSLTQFQFHLDFPNGIPPYMSTMNPTEHSLYYCCQWILTVLTSSREPQHPVLLVGRAIFQDPANVIIPKYFHHLQCLHFPLPWMDK